MKPAGISGIKRGNTINTREEECIKDIGEKATRKQTTRKIKTYMGE
jgi:hypothetical protein